MRTDCSYECCIIYLRNGRQPSNPRLRPRSSERKTAKAGGARPTVGISQSSPSARPPRLHDSVDSDQAIGGMLRSN
ncbi:hypothetical protein ASPVEDRAFT_732676 [Aspergillus versicolor CBS 583.65]|uniref:Uncharacterized protein n=1 Tax=Aspergillus versicolor CBS 583.65 TaxID=1036611 RepID=A0A1L9PPF6_ASPVE|nr:uncharacterized protein ASPVEDRAFT_732676 [Aspergillus versicolor CBS 583.65]OJJ03400.1 hypothetical protein ASPVEDRAFT_732676 [Aspergillus versicolor CBS 583.65]